MIKLEDILVSAHSNIYIMRGIYPIMFVDYRFTCNFIEDILQRTFLDKEVERFDSDHSNIRVWLKEEEE